VPPEPSDAPSDIAGFVRIIAGDLDPSVGKKMVAYLGLVGMPSDLNEIKVLEQVMAEAVKSAHNAMDLQVARARLVPRQEMDRMAALIRDAWWKSAQQSTSDIMAQIAALPIEHRKAVKDASEAAVANIATRVKEALSAG
jgi:hypothetical protein